MFAEDTADQGRLNLMRDDVVCSFSFSFVTACSASKGKLWDDPRSGERDSD